MAATNSKVLTRLAVIVVNILVAGLMGLTIYKAEANNKEIAEVKETAKDELSDVEHDITARVTVNAVNIATLTAMQKSTTRVQEAEIRRIEIIESKM